ncbi:hypothetical protein FRC00_008729 [Tulasnella sp. 408]|nr:hypothetical protein FRC00_008729 [Tulasnella sp. 408]
MYKMKDDDKNRNSWFSSARTLEDFQGNKYKFDTTVLMNNLTVCLFIFGDEVSFG